MKILAELKQQRGKVAVAMKSIVESADEKTGLTADQQSEWNKLNDEYNNLGTQIETAQQQDKINAEMDKFQAAGRDNLDNADKANGNPLASEEYLDALSSFVRGDATVAQMATLKKVNNTITTDGAGGSTSSGYAIPVSWRDSLIELLADNNVVRQMATVMRTDSTVNIPIVDDFGVAAYVGETNAYPASDISGANKQLKAHKIGRILKISEEALMDSAYDLVSLIGRGFQRSFGEFEENEFINGTVAAGKIRGILVDAQAGVTTAAVGAVSYDDMVKLKHSVREIYRNRPGFQMLVSDDLVAKLMLLKDADGRPIWQPSLQAGEPDRFLGVPYRTSTKMPGVATGNKAVAIGDFSYYEIADRGEIGLQRLDERYADEGLVGFKMYKRTDGILTVNEAIKTLTIQ